jgi:hypothetical protein
MSEGIFGLIGVFLGSFLAISSQFYFSLREEKKRNRETFLKESNDIISYIMIFRNTLKQVLLFINMDISELLTRRYIFRHPRHKK